MKAKERQAILQQRAEDLRAYNCGFRWAVKNWSGIGQGLTYYKNKPTHKQTKNAILVYNLIG